MMTNLGTFINSIFNPRNFLENLYKSPKKELAPGEYPIDTRTALFVYSSEGHYCAITRSFYFEPSLAFRYAKYGSLMPLENNPIWTIPED